MSEKVAFEEKEEQNIIVENGRKLYLAGLGVATMATEEVGNLFQKFWERGEETEQKAREMINEQVENRRKEAKKNSKKMEKELEKRLENVLHMVNIPSKQDIDKLSNKVTRLSRKVNELSKAE
jgi:poly(hydroxyalkanoate) granule-associated protein